MKWLPFTRVQVSMLKLQIRLNKLFLNLPLCWIHMWKHFMDLSVIFCVRWSLPLQKKDPF